MSTSFSLIIIHQISMAMTGDLQRKKAVVDALIKIKEVGILNWVEKTWAPTYPAPPRDDPSFRPANIAQVIIDKN